MSPICSGLQTAAPGPANKAVSPKAVLWRKLLVDLNESAPDVGLLLRGQSVTTHLLAGIAADKHHLDALL